MATTFSSRARFSHADRLIILVSRAVFRVWVVFGVQSPKAVSGELKVGIVKPSKHWFRTGWK